MDFTHGRSLGVSAAGWPFPHLLFQLILSHTAWRYAEVAKGEPFLARKQGLQAGLWALGCMAMRRSPAQISTVPAPSPTCTVVPTQFQ